MNTVTFPPLRFSARLLLGAMATISMALTGSLGAAERYALVIGNGAYKHGGILANPVSDAALMKTALTAAGFKVTALTDQSLEGMRRSLETFRATAMGGDAVAVYYSGHGMERSGENWLVPVDALVREEYQIPTRTLALSEVMGALEGTGAPLKIVLLDCCRGNPLGRNFHRGGGSEGSEGKGGGLTGVSDAPEGTVIAYATGPGKTAMDGTGRNSPFAEALAGALKEKDLTIEAVIKRTIGKVRASTSGQQVPWMSLNYAGHFVVRPLSSGSPSAPDQSASPRSESGPAAEGTTPVTAGGNDGLDYPYGRPIVGRKGFVYSPHNSTGEVDVTDIPSGKKVRCPYTYKIFRVP